MKPQSGTGKSTITFFVEGSDGKTVSANTVVRHLRQKLTVDEGILGFMVNKLQTTVCQNNCSGHGVCNEQTRLCECETFWMRVNGKRYSMITRLMDFDFQNLFKVYFNSHEDSDCSWSLLYVVLGVLCGVVSFAGSMWALIYLCNTWWSKPAGSRKSANYNLIENTDDLPQCKSMVSR